MVVFPFPYARIPLKTCKMCKHSVTGLNIEIRKNMPWQRLEPRGIQIE